MSELIDTDNQNNPQYNLATQVLKEYNIEPQNIKIIQDGGIKTVWKINAQDKVLCLKRLRHSYDKALFSVYAQDYIRKSGGNVPGVLSDNSNNLIVNYNDELFVLYEWIVGSNLEFSNSADLEKAVSGLSRFHALSKGYKAPPDARISTKLGRWPEQYDSMKNKFIQWKGIAKERLPAQCYSTYLKHVDDIIAISDKALKLLNTSAYTDFTSETSDLIVLCHQDYGKGNALLADDGVYVIDLDGVTFDHPSRDLRKIIGKIAENKGAWDLASISNILNWYRKENHINQDEEELLYIDLLYPHWFFGLVKNLFKNNKAISTSKLEKIAQLEKSKVPLLSSLIKRGEMV